MVGNFFSSCGNDSTKHLFSGSTDIPDDGWCVVIRSFDDVTASSFIFSSLAVGLENRSVSERSVFDIFEAEVDLNVFID